jgi:chromosomal replication initiation ATPase DnaA
MAAAAHCTCKVSAILEGHFKILNKSTSQNLQVKIAKSKSPSRNRQLKLPSQNRQGEITKLKSPCRNRQIEIAKSKSRQGQLKINISHVVKFKINAFLEMPQTLVCKRSECNVQMVVVVVVVYIVVQ